MTNIKISPSILSADFSKLGSEILDLQKAEADLIHIDVMDGHFVPNITIGPFVVKALRGLTKLPLDVHLMIENPESFIEDFAKAGSDIITVHQEATIHLSRTIQLIHDFGLKAGVSINPSTPVNTLDEIISEVELLLVMSVNPGYGGQTYIPSCTKKIKKLRGMIDESASLAELEVDGGINVDTVSEVVAAGANAVVAGSAVFNKSNTVTENVRLLRKKIESF